MAFGLEFRGRDTMVLVWIRLKGRVNVKFDSNKLSLQCYAIVLEGNKQLQRHYYTIILHVFSINSLPTHFFTFLVFSKH